MSVTLHFEAPTMYNISGWYIGESATSNGVLSVVASGTDIGSYPDWINSLVYASGDPALYYAVRFDTDDGYLTGWSDRMFGREGAGLGYFIFRPSGNIIYIIPPPTSGVNPEWLNYNTEYTINIKSSGLYGENTGYMLEDYEFFFTSEYCPLWSTATSVRLAAGPIIDAIPDDTVNRMIYKMSLKAIQLFFSGTNYYGCTWDTVPEALFRWVTCSAGMMALNAAIAGGATGGGNTTKRLGAMSISYDGGNDDGTKPGDVRKNLDDCIRDSSDVMGAELGTSVQYAIQSVNNTYIKHQYKNPSWGRSPRMIERNGNKGPWYDSWQYGEYTVDRK